MKIIFLLSFLTLSIQCFSKTTLIGKVTGNINNFLRLYYPINGFSNQTLPTKNSDIILERDGSFKINIDLNDPIFITLEVDGEPIWLLLQPNDFLKVVIDLTYLKSGYNSKWLSITGNNQAGHLLFNKLNFYPSKKYEGIQKIFSDSNYQDKRISVLANTIILKTILPYTILFHKKKISIIYKKIITKTITANLLSETLKFLNMGPKSMTLTKSKNILAERKKLFLLCNPFDTTLYKGLQTEFFIYQYYLSKAIETQAVSTENELKDSVLNISGEWIYLQKSFVPFLYINNLRLKEYLWGKWHYSFFLLFSQRVDGEEFKAFSKTFPNSRWLEHLSIDVLKNKNIIKTNLQKTLVLDTSNSINSFDSLMQKFNDRSVYVDLWASWCLPCRKEFIVKTNIDSFFTANRVLRVFISLDNPNAVNIWRSLITKYELEGYHILASQKLLDDIKKRLYKNDIITIPRYLIINHGVLVEADAYRPSDNQKLINQISLSLNFNN